MALWKRHAGGFGGKQDCSPAKTFLQGSEQSQWTVTEVTGMHAVSGEAARP